MKSKIAEAIKLSNNPVAVIRSDEKPEGALMFKEGVWGCVVAMINAASKGRLVALSDATVACQGGHAGCGFGPYKEGYVDKFLADGAGLQVEGERYKASQELALKFMRWQVVPAGQRKYLIMKPLADVTDTDKPDAVIFLVNADQLSGLATLANFDTENQDNVKLYFGAGCGQSIGNVLYAAELLSHFYQHVDSVGSGDIAYRHVKVLGGQELGNGGEVEHGVQGSAVEGGLFGFGKFFFGVSQLFLAVV